MNYLDIIIIVIYALGFLLLGYVFKGSKSGSDYFLGGKKFHWFPLSISTAATQLSAISFISAPAFVGLKQGGGLKWLTFEFAVPLAMLFLMVYLVPPMFKLGIVSVYEYLERRFGVSTRVLLSSVFQFSRGFSTSVMVYTVALILANVIGMPMWITIIIIGAITMIYSLSGGMKAVVYGDVIQMAILFIGILICLGYGLHYVGGWTEFTAAVDSDRLMAVDFTSMGFNGDEFGFWPMVIGGFFLYASYYGTDQSQVQRLFSAGDISTVRKALLCNGLMRFPITLIYCIMGLIIGVFVSQNADFSSMIPADKPDLMIPVFIKEYLPHGVIGILLIAILSAAMSSLSSTINSLSAASVEDFFNRDKSLADATYMEYSKRASIFWGLFCLVLAFFTGNIADTVIEAINKIGSVFYGPILATFICAIGLKKIHSLGINLGIIAGVLVNMYLWLFVDQIFWFWWNAIGAIVTILVAVVTSILIKRNTKEVEEISQSESPPVINAVILVAFFIFMVILCVNLPSMLQ